MSPVRRSPGQPLLILATVLALALMAYGGSGASSEPSPTAPKGAAIEKLGVTYGPFRGRRCRHVHRGCGLVGIDIVFAHPATRVEAIAGSQTIRLRTPGQHSRVPYHDWVGTFTRTGFARTPHPHRDLVYVPVELRVRFADGHHASALFPHVRVLSGWG
jgi:hypothetical protein